MVSGPRGSQRVAAIVFGCCLLLASASNAFAHARFDRSEPPAGGMVDGQPFVLAAYFTQELTSKSTLTVVDANGSQVDLGDGHVDLNDPDRKIMYVSLPELPVGVYTVQFTAQSAEDGHDEPGSFTFGVGMLPSGAEQPSEVPVEPTGADCGTSVTDAS